MSLEAPARHHRPAFVYERVNPSGIRKDCRDNLMHRPRKKVKGYLLHFQGDPLRLPVLFSYGFFRSCAGNDYNQASLVSVVVSVGGKRIQFAVGQG